MFELECDVGLNSWKWIGVQLIDWGGVFFPSGIDWGSFDGICKSSSTDNWVPHANELLMFRGID